MIQVLENMADIAHTMDTARFRKEALYASRKMGSRISAKEEMVACLEVEDSVPSFVRRKAVQGKAQFRKGPDEPQK